MNRKKYLEIDDLVLSFEDPASGKRSRVIRNTGLTLYENEILGIVGESGAGKSVITTAALGLLNSTSRIENGTIKVDGVDVTNFNDRQWSKSKLLGSTITAVFQNPLETLNPYQTVAKQLIESFRLNNKGSKAQARAAAIKSLKELRFDAPEVVMSSYPHQLSGGMRQRVVIASALLANPKILVLDEPTTALDPTVEHEIINIIKEIKKTRDLSVIIITHDLSVIASLADRINVMYAGKVIEYGTSAEIMNFPQHPYTWGLLRSVFGADKNGRFYSIPGRAPFDLNDIKGDAFAPRNEGYLLEMDTVEHPPFFKISPTHAAATWLLDKRAPEYLPPKAILERWKKSGLYNPSKSVEEASDVPEEDSASKVQTIKVPSKTASTVNKTQSISLSTKKEVKLESTIVYKKQKASNAKMINKFKSNQNSVLLASKGKEYKQTISSDGKRIIYVGNKKGK